MHRLWCGGIWLAVRVQLLVAVHWEVVAVRLEVVVPVGWNGVSVGQVIVVFISLATTVGLCLCQELRVGRRLEDDETYNKRQF